MEHHYLITEEIPEIAEHGKEICGGVDYEGNIYFRQEHKGLLLGTYEGVGTPWKVGGTPSDFGHELLPEDLDRAADRLEAGEIFPMRQGAGGTPIHVFYDVPGEQAWVDFADGDH